MLPDTIPEGLPLPTEPMGMKGLAALYKRSVSTIQRAFTQLEIDEAVGLKINREYLPEQLIIIFALYFPPSKYYATFLWLEKNGYIETLLKKNGLTDHKDRIKKKLKEKKEAKATANAKPKATKKKKS